MVGMSRGAAWEGVGADSGSVVKELLVAVAW